LALHSRILATDDPGARLYSADTIDYLVLKDYRLRWRPNAFGLLFENAKGQPITSCYVRRAILHAVRERLGIPRGASMQK
jgi:hypothetical protein